MVNKFNLNARLITDYFIVTLVLILEVTVFFSDTNFLIPRGEVLLAFVIVLTIYLKRGGTLRIINKSFFILIIGVLLLILLQGVFFGLSILTLFTYVIFVFITPYLLYKSVGSKIFDYIVNIILITGVVSTIIWFFQNIYSPLNVYLQILRLNPELFFVQGNIEESRISVAFIYTITYWYANFFGYEILRNSGLYHEPGAFAYFLILAIGLNTIIKSSFLNKKNIVLSAILLTTFSTAGYISFFLLLSFSTIKSNINIVFRLLVFPIFLFISIALYTQLDFMGDKMTQQFETELTDDTVFEDRGGRIRRIRASLNLLSTSPIIGRGIISASREFELGSIYYFTGAGFWRTLSSYGIIIAPLLFFYYYKGIRRLCEDSGYDTKFVLFFFVAIILGATSQRFFMDNITLLLLIHGLLSQNVQEVNDLDEINI
jgi:hypothetical protein